MYLQWKLWNWLINQGLSEILLFGAKGYDLKILLPI